MLKKIHTSKSLNHVQNKECDVQCLVCKNYSNTILYVCESGHLLCKSCRSGGKDEPIQEEPRKKIEFLHGRHTTSLNISDKTDKILKDCELASGDNEKIYCNYKALKQEHSDPKAVNIDDLKVKRFNTNNNDITNETIIKYKNSKFNGSTSSVDSISMNMLNNKNETIYKGLEDNLTLSRPVKCPVTTCGKMIAIDSTMQHFYFDHSKVAKTTLRPRKSHKIIQKSCTFTKNTQCIGILVHQNIPSKSCHQRINLSDGSSSNDENHLLLMCATKRLNSSKISGGTNISITQKRNETSQEMSKILENDEVIMLWLCIIGNNMHSYKITLSREDKLLSYSFAGEPLNIRDSQDADTVYDKSNCLIIRGVAANRLLDSHNQFHIYVSIV